MGERKNMGKERSPDGLHVALVMDGNGRWAEARGWPRVAGHRAGAGVVRRVVAAAPELGIGTLTLFGFSSANWRRPRSEIEALMGIFRRFFERGGREYPAAGIRLSLLGRSDRLPPALRRAVARAEAATAGGGRLHLRVALDYSSRDALYGAAAALAAGGAPDRERFERLVTGAGRESAAAPDVDLLVRTGGEKRLSDFLLWECAQAELIFLDLPWPEFGPDRLAECLREFARRERRFGGLPARV